jgi:hypothetical protein
MTSTRTILVAQDASTGLTRTQYDHEFLRQNRDLLVIAQTLQQQPAIPFFFQDKVEKAKY